MSSISMRKASLLAGILGIGVAAVFLLFAGLTTNQTNGPASFDSLNQVLASPAISGSNSNSYSSSTPGIAAGQPAFVTLRNIPDATRALGTLGVLGGASLGVAVFATTYASKRIENHEKKNRAS